MGAKNTPPTAEQIVEMQRYYDETNHSLRMVAKHFGWGRHTLMKYLRARHETLSDAQRRWNRVKSVVNWRRRTKEALVEYKGGKCVRCGYSKCIDALEFHHRDPSKKDFSVSGKTWSLERLKKEVDKCDLVCSNCHREIHAESKLIGS